MSTRQGARLAARLLRTALSIVAFFPAAAFTADAPSAGLAPRAIAWAEQQSAAVARAGRALTPAQSELAKSVGVRHPELIRIQVVENFPLPQDAEVKAAAMRIGLDRPSIIGLTLGHSVLLRRGFENDVELLSHEFRHVWQYEDRGGIAPFLVQHLQDLARFGYDDSPFEVDARAHEVSRGL